MAKSTKRTARTKPTSPKKSNEANETQAAYGKEGGKGKRTKGKGYDAQKFAGTIPGIADWYVDSLREEARQTMDKADQLSKVMLRGTKRDKRKKDDRDTPGIIDVDRFSGALPHLKGDAVRTQRKLRDEA
jgi:hypothetical protein